MTLGPTKEDRDQNAVSGRWRIVAGNFQQEFFHGVPPRRTWEGLKQSGMYASMSQWEKDAMTKEVDMHQQAVSGAVHVRMNCTIRRRDRHIPRCPVYEKSRAVGGNQLVVTGAFQAACIGASQPLSGINRL